MGRLYEGRCPGDGWHAGLDVVVPDEGEIGRRRSWEIRSRGVSKLFHGVVAKAVKERTRQVWGNSSLHKITNT
ncbi:hypothetical protein VM1G_11376 [Cytospora mali]|uniref:Uncharacterized protein n=1 Tax=Cytospora mali TaxID=578113 RepID=A0A194VPN6_CYTMA|nr:hypothetical protein VM1G_11376 [Valsa mali]